MGISSLSSRSGQSSLGLSGQGSLGLSGQGNLGSLGLSSQSGQGSLGLSGQGNQGSLDLSGQGNQGSLNGQNRPGSRGRLLISGTHSGCGKTTVTCAILAALQARGIQPTAFKSGPDYIDPMFHRAISGMKAYNLDPFFLDGDGLRGHMAASAGRFSLIEGAMGYYDGIAATDEASAYTVARQTQTPVILVVGARGAGYSLAAMIEGFMRHRLDSNIKGVVFNDAGEGRYPDLAHIAEEAGLQAYGVMPFNEAWRLPSRHLGLMAAAEIEDLYHKLKLLGAQAEQSIDMDGLIVLAGTAPALSRSIPRDVQHAAGRVGAAGAMGPAGREYSDAGADGPGSEVCAPGEVDAGGFVGKAVAVGTASSVNVPDEAGGAGPAIAAGTSGTVSEAGLAGMPRIRLAVARDKAFCFLYEENLELLQLFGCELVFFSPLHDGALPEKINGLYLCGGYPELYRKELADNKPMREGIKRAVENGLPSIAECGGFLYLHASLDGFPMCGVIHGAAFETKGLRRFGYITLTAGRQNLLCEAGGSIRAHEFHYWDSDCPGDGFTARKAGRDIAYPCVHATDSLYAGFPHLYFPANPKFAANFVERMAQYQR